MSIFRNFEGRSTQSQLSHPKSNNNNNTSHPFYLRQFLLTTFFILLSLLSIQTINADIISLNSGGSTEIVVNSDRYIEGFFFGLNPICGNGVTESGEQCDDGNVVNSDGCSSTCQTETPGGGGDTGGGGGGGDEVILPPVNILVTPTEFNINLAIDTTTPKTISVTNLGTSTINVVVSQQSLGNHIILGSTSLTIPTGETVDLDVVFVALSEPGVFAGKIIIGGHEILVSLNVKTKLLLFDSNIVVLNPDITVVQGGSLRTLVTLIPLGDPERLDVTLNFAVKDYTNKVYLTKSETILVDKLTELRRNFDTGLLSPGDYVISLELVYPNGVAPSSAHFRVVEKSAPNIFGRIILFLIIMIVVISIFIIIILIWRRRKKKKEERTSTKLYDAGQS